MKQLLALLFPSIPRDFPFRRNIRNLLRALHILFTGILIGGLVFQQAVTALEPWLYAAVLSGLLLLATDLYAGIAVLFEVRGLLIMLKIGLLFLIPLFWDFRVLLLICIVFISVFGSHMSKRYRHKVLFFSDQVTPDERNG